MNAPLRASRTALALSLVAALCACGSDGGDGDGPYGGFQDGTYQDGAYQDGAGGGAPGPADILLYAEPSAPALMGRAADGRVAYLDASRAVGNAWERPESPWFHGARPFVGDTIVSVARCYDPDTYGNHGCGTVQRGGVTTESFDFYGSAVQGPPRVSPDGSLVAIRTVAEAGLDNASVAADDESLLTIRAIGGDELVSIDYDTVDVRFTPDDRLVSVPRSNPRVFRVTSQILPGAAEEPPREFAVPDEAPGHVRAFDVSPDGSLIAYAMTEGVGGGLERQALRLLSLATGEDRLVAATPAYVPGDQVQRGDQYAYDFHDVAWHRAGGSVYVVTGGFYTPLGVVIGTNTANTLVGHPAVLRIDVGGPGPIDLATDDVDPDGGIVFPPIAGVAQVGHDAFDGPDHAERADVWENGVRLQSIAP